MANEPIKTTGAASGGAAPAPPWHALSIEDALARLGSRPSGLTDDEARSRLAQYGPNALAPPERASVLHILIDQLKSVIVGLLAAAVAISLMFGDRAEAIAIGAVLVINTLIGVVTELRARRAMEALIELDIVQAWVVRGGTVRTVDARDLVPGDVVDIEAERQVPADGRLIQSSDLRVDEAILTGESTPADKVIEAQPADAPLADRHDMVFKRTLVVSGLARVVVTATGPATEVGRIAKLVGDARPRRTPLELRLDALGRRLVWLALAAAAVVAGLGAIQGAPPLLLFQTAIALAVAAVPEALPAVATITLAVGMRRMARRKALVRRLTSVETLGSTTVVCTDKTRTLTSGQMTVVRVWAADGQAAAPFHSPADPVARCLEAAALASRPGVTAADGTTKLTEPEDAAAIAAAAEAGRDRARLAGERPELGVLPFTSARRFMAAIHQLDGQPMAYVKGAPRAVFDLSARVATGHGDETLDASRRDALLAVNERLAGDGLRVLAVAAGAVNGTAETGVRDLTFLGFLGLADPPAAGVPDAIARLRAAGLRTVMLTGDQRLTAQSVGHQLGLLTDHDRVLDGREFDALSDAGRATAAAEVNAFSRISPEHKLVVVRALQTRGEIVAMIGDGVNDAPALAQADIGVAMGQRGTDAAKEAAAIVLLDDRFQTVAAAVEEGRVVFDNIRKFVFYLFSCNVAEIMVLLFAGVAGLPLPLLPLQLLWLNLVTDTFPALALAVEPADTDIMSRPPRRPDDAVLSAGFIRAVLLYGSLITAATLAAFVWALDQGAPHASTVAFMTLAFAQTAHLVNARSAGSRSRPAGILTNPFALLGAGITIGLQLLAAYLPPLARMLHVSPLQPIDWAVILGLASVLPIVGQGLRWIATPGRTRRY
jgi:Ca2+-transporting ATPase